MREFLGGSLGELLGVTLLLFGGAGLMMGQALAATWRSPWQAVPYALLLAAANRFMSFALFDGELLSATGFAIDAAVVLGLALAAFRATRAHIMVRQYPWLYERTGPFGWREKPGAGQGG